MQRHGGKELLEGNEARCNDEAGGQHKQGKGQEHEDKARLDLLRYFGSQLGSEDSTHTSTKGWCIENMALHEMGNHTNHTADGQDEMTRGRSDVRRKA